jgi:hypothetical protein
MLVGVSCAVNQDRKAAQSPADREGSEEADTIVLTPPEPLDDDWTRSLIGQWNCLAESDLPGFKTSVKGRGQVKVELGLGGQFLLIQKEGKMTRLSDEYLSFLREKLHASDEEIRALQDMTFADLELRSIDPKTGRIVAYLFDSWRCVAQGSGKRTGNREIMEWKWSLAGAGTSVRITEKLSDDKVVSVERYKLVDGSTMEDRSVMVRKQSAPADSGDLALLTK